MAYWETDDGWHPYTPLHVREGMAGPWQRWFAWFPVVVDASPGCDGRRVWLTYVERRWFYPPTWFIPPAPHRWREYRVTPTDTKGER